MEHCTAISKAKIKWIRSLRLKKNRDAEQLFIVEGEKMVNEGLIEFSDHLVFLIVQKENIHEISEEYQQKTVFASTQEMEQCSGFKQPNKFIAVFKSLN